MSEYFDLIIIGAGPAGLMNGYTLIKNNKNLKIKILEQGKELNNRDHNYEKDLTNGIGGAGLFSDGKFSWFPAGNEIWKYDKKYMLECYDDLKIIFNELGITIPEYPNDNDISTYIEKKDNWNLKNYAVTYLSLEQRKKMINIIERTVGNNIQYNTTVTNITKKNDIYRIYTSNGEIFETKVINMCGGRFMPLFSKELKFINHEFKRLEFGFRIEGNYNHKLFNHTKLIDPKYTRNENGNTFLTFCWCRKGETSETNHLMPNGKNIISWSGRSDVIVTEYSNFGFNYRIRDESKMYLLENALNTSSFSVVLTEDTENNIPITYKEIYSELITQLKIFIEPLNINIFDGSFKIKGPTIEGVGYYPITDNNMKVPNEQIYVSGDSNGKFRGIIQSMLSGSFVALNFLSEYKQPKKKNIIFLSGKRFVGKSSVYELLNRDANLKIKKISFSDLLKKKFCEINNLDYHRMLVDHQYKNNFRNELTNYFNNCEIDKIIYAEELHKLLNEIHLEDYDVILVDDLRLLIHYDYMKKYLPDNEYNKKFIRINSNDYNRKLRGWIESEYDKDPCENELDNQIFDFNIQNDFINLNDYYDYLSTLNLIQ